VSMEEWQAQHPAAARDLARVFGAIPWPEINPAHDDKSEAWAQQKDRFAIREARAFSWRNNVGATPARCDDCGAKQQPVRYGLANDSARLNKQIKSSDLILAIPRLIEQKHVGTVIAQFGSVESKKPGWVYTGKGREPGQAAWLALINRIGGFATFSTGDLKL